MAKSLKEKPIVLSETVESLISEDMEEMKESDGRRLNLICLTMPKSEKETTTERKQNE